MCLHFLSDPSERTHLRSRVFSNTWSGDLPGSGKFSFETWNPFFFALNDETDESCQIAPHGKLWIQSSSPQTDA